MVSIAQVVKKIIDTKPFLQEALLKEIINYGALADLLIDEVTENLGKEPKHSAVMMAIRRYQEKLTQSPFTKLEFKSSSFNVRSGLFTITMESSSTLHAIGATMHQLLKKKRDSFFTITEGVTEVTIIADQKYKTDILKLLKKETILSKKMDMASLTITIPEEALGNYGVYYTILRKLTWEAINVAEIVSTNRELVILLTENDVMRAFNALRRE